MAQTTYRIQHSSGVTVATGITTNAPSCGSQPSITIRTLMSTSAFDCASDRIEAPSGQVIIDAYIGTAYAQDMVVTGVSYSFRIRSNGSPGTVSGRLFYVDASGTQTFIGSAVTSSSIDNEANFTIALSSQTATVPAGHKLGFRLQSNGQPFRLFWGSAHGAFGGTLIVSETIAAAPAPSMTLAESVSPSGTQVPGTELAFTGLFTNGGTAAALGVVITNPVPSNTDFKVGSATQNLGTTGLSVVVAYSSDGGSTWTYSPASGAGGAPAGFDRVVTHVRWTFTGSLSPTAPGNAGSVSAIMRIR